MPWRFALEWATYKRTAGWFCEPLRLLAILAQFFYYFIFAPLIFVTTHFIQVLSVTVNEQLDARIESHFHILPARTLHPVMMSFSHIVNWQS